MMQKDVTQIGMIPYILINTCYGIENEDTTGF